MLKNIFTIETILGIFACSNDVENSQINRRIVLYNIINKEYILTIEGLCSIEQNNNFTIIICNTGPRQYKKTFIKNSDNLTYFVDENTNLNKYYYKITFDPRCIIPDIQVK